MASYTFDLQAEVTDALALYAEALDRVVFYDTRGLADKLFMKPFGPEHAAVIKFSPGLTFAKIDKTWNHYLNFGHSSAGASCMLSCPMAANAIFIGDKGVNGPINREFEFFIHFWHEIGHIVVPDASNNTVNQNKRDCLADAFAAIHFLKKFPEEINQLKLWSQERTDNLIRNFDVHHYTSPVLEAIIADSSRVNLGNLHPPEVIQKALDYAQEYQPAPWNRIKATQKNYPNP